MVAIGQLFIISAPSGAGKTSLVKALLTALSGFEVSVSHTTRAQRSGEKDGVDYHFTDVGSFQKIVESNGFLEYATVFGNAYGTSRASVEDKLAQGVDVVLEIDWQGTQQVREMMGDCCSIFVLPPSKQVLEDRLKGRGQDSDEIITQRMCMAMDEMSHYKEYDFLVVNDDFAVAVNELTSIIESKRLDMERGKVTHATLIKQLVN